MRPAAYVLVTCLSLAFLAGCQTATPVIPEPATYQYTAFDTQDQPVVTGTLRLVQTGSTVEGTWSLKAADGVKFADIGPQAGDGTLTGEAGKNTLVLNLQPGSIDNKVILDARSKDRMLSGRWLYVGFGGVVAEGAFVALQQ